MGFLFVVGSLFVVFMIYHAFSQFISMKQLVRGSDLASVKKYGGWTVVTGCTDGIGKAYCLEMVSVLDKFVLIGRNAKKLSSLSVELAARNTSVEVITLTVDFVDELDYERIESQLAKLDIGIFMNFVGVSYPLPQLLHQLDEKFDGLSWEHINVNVMSATNMTRLILPGMVKRNSGLIIYVSSGSSTQPTPMQTSYAAGKKLLDHLALSLAAEYPDLDFQSIKPYYVATKMTQNKLRHNYNFTTMIPSAEEYTRQALGTIGTRISTHGYAPHCIQSWMRNFIPEFMVGQFVLRKMKKQRDG